MTRQTDLAFRIADRLAVVYVARPVEIATACDEVIDRSGNLLGWLREYRRLAADDIGLEPETLNG